jgi:hypothetical protein
MNPHVHNIGMHFATKRQIPPAVYTPGTTDGTGIDLKAIGSPQSCKIVANSGAQVGSTADVKLQHSTDNVTFTDYVPPRGPTGTTPGVAADGACAQIAAANTLSEKNVDLSSANQYIRLRSVVAGGTSITLEAHITVGGGNAIPQL